MKKHGFYQITKICLMLLRLTLQAPNSLAVMIQYEHFHTWTRVWFHTQQSLWNAHHVATATYTIHVTSVLYALNILAQKHFNAATLVTTMGKSPKWSSAEKPQTTIFRWTGDLRDSNKCTDLTQKLPHVSKNLDNGIKCENIV